MVSKVWSTLQSGEDTYEFFEYLGRFPGGAKNPEKPNIEMWQSSLNTLIDSETLNEILALNSDLVITKSTDRTLDLSVRKMDQEPCYDFQRDPHFPRAKELLLEMYREALCQAPLSIDDTLARLDLSKSCGFVATRSGYRSKGEFFNAGHLYGILQKSICKEIPLWRVSGKIEADYRCDYVNEFKQRTFIIEPPELLFHRKRIYGNQNEGMKQHAWSMYGFNPYEGGVDRMAQTLLKHKRFWEWDAKKWDRKASWMRSIYEVRNHFVIEDDFRDWVTENGIVSVLVLPNGDVIRKRWGNNSGSGTTTGDNILGMSLIVLHMLLRLFDGDESKFKNKVEVCCFGDDVVGSDDLDVSDESLEKCIRETFALYGHELDPLKIVHSLEECSFLGFRFHKSELGWVPQYDLGVISKSFLFLKEDLDLQAQISKLMSLLIMTAGHGNETYNIFKDAVTSIVYNSQSEFCTVIKKHGIPDYNTTMAWYLGLEDHGLPEIWKIGSFD